MNNMLNRTMMGEYMKKQCVSRTFDSPSNASGKASFTVILNAAQFKRSGQIHHDGASCQLFPLCEREKCRGHGL